MHFLLLQEFWNIGFIGFIVVFWFFWFSRGFFDFCLFLLLQEFWNIGFIGFIVFFGFLEVFLIFAFFYICKTSIILFLLRTNNAYFYICIYDTPFAHEKGRLFLGGGTIYFFI